MPLLDNAYASWVFNPDIETDSEHGIISKPFIALVNCQITRTEIIFVFDVYLVDPLVNDVIPVNRVTKTFARGIFSQIAPNTGAELISACDFITKNYFGAA